MGATSFPGEFGKGNTSVKTTLPETNIAPEHRPPGKGDGSHYFLGGYVSFRECIVLVRVYNQHCQETILLIVFDFQGKYMMNLGVTKNNNPHLKSMLFVSNLSIKQL